MLWLCLRCSQLPLDILSRAGTPQPPLVISEAHNVLLHCERAGQQGIVAGMPLTTAKALCKNLNITPRSPTRERQALNGLAHWAYGFTPAVHIKEPDSLLLEVQSSLTLFGGIDKLWQRLSKGVDQRGFRHCFGIGNTAIAAWLSSFLPDTAKLIEGGAFTVEPASLRHWVEKVPLACWGFPASLQQKLSAAGLVSAQQLLALPRKALGRRYGKTLLSDLYRLTGELPEPTPRWKPPARFYSEIHFLHGVANTEQLLFPMRRLLTELCDYLRARQLHCRAFHWHCHTFKRQQTWLDITLAAAKNQFEDFFALTRLKLENWKPEAEIETLALSSDEFAEAQAIHRELFANPNSTDKPPTHLLEQLSARLGDQVYSGLSTADSHLPEAAWQTPPARLETNTATTSATKPTDIPLRPTWLLRHPVALHYRNGTVFWQGPLELRQGPERIDSHWWQQRQQRDYFIARHPNGAHYWIFQDRADGRWYLHGIFA